MTHARMLAVASLSLLTLLVLQARAVAADDTAKDAVQLPTAAGDAIKKAYPKATIQKVKAEKEGDVTVYEVKLTSGETKLEVTVTGEGTICEVDSQIAVADLPKAVAEAVAQAAPDAKVSKASKEEILADPKTGKLDTPKATYEVEVTKDGKEGEMKLAADGKVLEELKWKEAGKEDGDKKGDNKKEHESKQTGQH
jgi:hypothetical protein